VVKIIQELGAKILKPFGRIRKALLKAKVPDIDMPDHFAFIGFEGAFAPCIQRNGFRSGIRRPAPADGIPEELENIIVLHLARRLLSRRPWGTLSRTRFLPLSGKNMGNGILPGRWERCRARAAACILRAMRHRVVDRAMTAVWHLAERMSI